MRKPEAASQSVQRKLEILDRIIAHCKWGGSYNAERRGYYLKREAECPESGHYWREDARLHDFTLCTYADVLIEAGALTECPCAVHTRMREEAAAKKETVTP